MKKPSMISVLLFLTGLLCIVALFFFNKSTLDRITTTEQEVDAISEQITAKHDEIKQAVNKYTSAIDTVQSNIDHMKQKQQTVSQKKTKEKAEVEEETTSKPSVFSQNNTSSSSGTSVFSSGSEGNGHIIGIDPGHQSESVDMSALEPNGPGSSEMKAKCSTGTQGSYSGVPEYQLNLEVSLQLRDELEQRGYQVVMTRTDNETAISNMERAQYVAAEGAEIYVRIHANGDDSHTASGALSMSPSQNNPYIPQLFDESNRLSQCIIDSYCAATGFQNLGVQYYDNMTGINWSTVPVTILEMGFMTNQNDDLKLNDAEFQKTMVQGIANGIDNYFGIN
ncbi:N-acetylmuramoyl-L-alanine amidase [Blautia sp.]